MGTERPQQNQEHVQDLKPDRGHGEEVDRHHGLDVILKESPPVLRRRLPPAYDVLAHAGLADIDAELEQFAVDAGRAPKADSRGSSSESVGESLWTPLGARVGRDELSMSRTAGSPCGASQ